MQSQQSPNLFAQKKLMKTALIFLLLFTLNNTAQTNEKNYRIALENIDKKKYKKALSSINKVLEKEKKEQYILTKSTILNNLDTPPKEIITFLNQYLINRPTSNLLIERGLNYQRIFRFQDAILDYSKAIKISTEDSILVKALDYRGSLYQKIRKPKLAKLDYERAYELDSNSYSICNNFSIVLDDLGDAERARYLLLKIVEKDSTNVHAVMNLGYFSSVHENYNEALIYLNKALDLEPNSAYTLSNISFVKLKLGLTNEALKDVNKSLEINNANSYAYKNRALIYLELNKKNQACEDLNTALKYGYSEFFGPEVNELIKLNCLK